MNNMAFSSHLQNVPGRITASTACPGASDVGYGTSEENGIVWTRGPLFDTYINIMLNILLQQFQNNSQS